MATTQNLHLPQFDGSDRIHHEDFNAAFETLDAAVAAAGNCRIATGTYIGSGAFGSSGKTTLTFSKKPLAVFIGGGSNFGIMVRSGQSGLCYEHNNSRGQLIVTWGDNSVQWYATGNPGLQLNQSGTTYSYLAVVE